MELKNCIDFSDVFFAVINHKADIKKAVKMTTKIKKYQPMRTEDFSELKHLWNNYPQHTEIIDKLAGIN
jgi:hypothetical protein